MDRGQHEVTGMRIDPQAVQLNVFRVTVTVEMHFPAEPLQAPAVVRTHRAGPDDGVGRIVGDRA
jgi:hypothetical protein